jgi:hypothetical protein
MAAFTDGGLQLTELGPKTPEGNPGIAHPRGDRSGLICLAESRVGLTRVTGGSGRPENYITTPREITR